MSEAKRDGEWALRVLVGEGIGALRVNEADQLDGGIGALDRLLADPDTLSGVALVDALRPELRAPVEALTASARQENTLQRRTLRLDGQLHALAARPEATHLLLTLRPLPMGDRIIRRLVHDLRNPLAALRTAVELLRAPGAEARLPRLTALIDRQLDEALKLLDGTREERA